MEYNPLELFLRNSLFGIGIFFAMVALIGSVIIWYRQYRDKKK